ncbi:c-type cytochrome [Cognatishimia maritima]|uniref:Cytochrome C oxidase, cbb3-type, subunit III n=1 Tax=Cognatishimia maritima TaxID=870908 RepID=A0A1M5NBU3_9RHOB|nr:cytochrome c [Cognatishimia maritima]SHG86961.1 Cytochrome C oxidase, cbb3-type, subunit III [Cognatishimia maritima]
MVVKFSVTAILVCLALPATAQGIIPYQDAESVARGAVLYQDNCAACHGEALEGQENWQQRDEDGFLPAPPHDETGHTWHHGDGLLFDITKRGTAAVVGDGYQSNMPGFAEVLSDQEILDTLAFIKSTWSNRMIEIQNSRN